MEADVVLAGTASASPVITEAMFRPLLKRRRHRPLFLIDLAVPRDVEPAVGTLPNVYLYNIDDLNAALAEIPERREKIQRCEALVRDAAERCVGIGQQQDLGVLVRQLRQKLLAIGDDEKLRTRRKLAALGINGESARVEQLLDEHTHRLLNKVLHLPLSRLESKARPSQTAPDTGGVVTGEKGGESGQKGGADGCGADAVVEGVSVGFYAAALRRLFDLDESRGEAEEVGDGGGAMSEWSAGQVPGAGAPAW